MPKEPYSIEKLLGYLEWYKEKPGFFRFLATMRKLNNMESGRKK